MAMERQYAFSPQTNHQLAHLLVGALWDYPGKMTLSEYTNTLQWGPESSVLADTIYERPGIANMPIMYIVTSHMSF